MLTILFLCLISPLGSQQLSILRSDYDSLGVRLASNDHVVAVAINDRTRYEFYLSPFGPNYFCAYDYSLPEDFIISLAIGQRQSLNAMTFVYLSGDDENENYLELGIFQIDRTKCLNNSESGVVDEIVIRRFNLSLDDLVSVLKVDLYGRYAYGFLEEFIYILDIARRNVTVLNWKNVMPNVSKVYPKDAYVTQTKDGVEMIILVGYFRVNLDATLPAVYLLRLEPPFRMYLVDNQTLVTDRTVGGTFAFVYDFSYVMSVSIEHETQQALIALPHYKKTILFHFNETRLNRVQTFVGPARSVIWLDRGIQAALLFAETRTPPWAASQIQVINTTAPDPNLATLYAIPNNQQTISFAIETHLLTFIRLDITAGQPIILTDNGFVINIPLAPPGYYIPLTEIGSDPNAPQRCPNGTFRTTFSPSPCLVCPTGYRKSFSSIVQQNTTNEEAFACIRCAPKSYCPLASVGDVDLSRYPSISQAYPYPTSPPSTNFDDIIITNAFRLSAKDPHCLLVSPIFWTLVVLAVALIILIIMLFLYWRPSKRHHFHRLARALRHTDLIGDGELWIGGLISFALLVLITFGFWFGSVFLKQYPIETAGDAYFSCDKSLRNAKFSSNLRLTSVVQSEDEKPIFNMLDEQNWTLIIDFIQTGFRCEDIVVEGNIESFTILLPILDCIDQPDEATRTVIVALSSHNLRVAVNLLGNSYIGATRLCLNGSTMIDEPNRSTVKALAYCHLLSSEDQTMSQSAKVHLEVTKVINRTEGLGLDDPMTYSGIWIPTLTVKSYNDRAVYNQLGNYIRYLSPQQVLSIDFSESQFFIQNNQEPIARSNEIFFHNILFSTVCIELFALAFVLFKLALLPLVRCLVMRIRHRTPEEDKLNTKF